MTHTHMYLRIFWITKNSTANERYDSFIGNHFHNFRNSHIAIACTGTLIFRSPSALKDWVKINSYDWFLLASLKDWFSAKINKKVRASELSLSKYYVGRCACQYLNHKTYEQFLYFLGQFQLPNNLSKAEISFCGWLIVLCFI